MNVQEQKEIGLKLSKLLDEAKIKYEFGQLQKDRGDCAFYFRLLNSKLTQILTLHEATTYLIGFQEGMEDMCEVFPY